MADSWRWKVFDVDWNDTIERHNTPRSVQSKTERKRCETYVFENGIERGRVAHIDVTERNRLAGQLRDALERDRLNSLALSFTYFG